MNRFLTCTAVGLFLSFAPALAEPQRPVDDGLTPPEVNQPSQIPEVMPADPSAPSDPAAPIPGGSTQMSPDVAPMQPGDVAPSAHSSQAPQSIEPAAPKLAEAAGSPQFLMKQASDDWLATNLIGEPVYNAQDEVIGDINDLVADQNGKVVAALIGSGGILGIGEKHVALRFEDLRLARDESNNVKIIANLNQETLAAAPDYETLAEQTVTVGSTKGDREDSGGQKTY